MTSIEHANESLVGLGPDAETRLPAEWVERRQRLSNAFAIAVLLAIQLAWMTILMYAAYEFMF